MSSISTEGPAHPITTSSFRQRASERAFAVAFVSATAIASIGWLYALSEGLVTVIDWMLF